jgi:hypothetical protein
MFHLQPKGNSIARQSNRLPSAKPHATSTQLCRDNRRLARGRRRGHRIPKIPVRKPNDSRTLVDRLLARIKNNRFAAAVILVGLGIGGVASVTDSARKLGGAIPPLASRSVAGEWKSDEAAFYRFLGTEAGRLYLQQATTDQVISIIQFGGNAVRPMGLPDHRRQAHRQDVDAVVRRQQRPSRDLCR